MDSLSSARHCELEKGVEVARRLLEAVMQQVQTFFDLHSIVSAGPFLYVFIQNGAPNAHLFSRPSTLTLLAQHALRAHASVTGKKSSSLPLVLSAPLSEAEGTCLVVGVPPVSDRSRRNLLGKAFEQALKRTGSRLVQKPKNKALGVVK